jgi:peptidyl-prolyl cis-trans isomerase C
MTNISINGVSISNAAMDYAAQQAREDVSPDAIARAAAVRELLRQRAVEKGLLESDADHTKVDDAIEELLEQEVIIPELPAREECLRFYNANLQKFQSGEIVYARHILFAVTPGAPLELIRAKAEQTLHELMHNPDHFSDLARECSNCPSGTQDGNLGQLTRGETVPEFESALFGDNNTTGILPGLVRTRYGFHIVAIDHRVEGNQLPFEAVRDKIETCLMGRVQEKALIQYVQILAGQADVIGIELAGTTTPLVQ